MEVADEDDVMDDLEEEETEGEDSTDDDFSLTSAKNSEGKKSLSKIYKEVSNSKFWLRT